MDRVKVQIFKEHNFKKLPLKTFFCDFDQDIILDKADEILLRLDPDWKKEHEKYSIVVIPAEPEK